MQNTQPPRPADYPFNDDLLFDKEDQRLAGELYPNVHPALHHPELEAVFKRFDAEANAAKSRSRRWGTAAVALVTFALLATSAEPLYRAAPFEQAIVIASAAAGVIGALFGFFGLLFASSKRRWLENRLLTESLRQFHFQTILMLSSLILKAAETGDWTTFEQRRATEWGRIQKDLVARASTVFDSTVGQDVEQDPWHFREPPPLADSPHADEFVAAYQRLRVERQVQYASYKLRDDGRLLSSMPRTQARRLEVGALVCVVGLIAVHLVILPGIEFDERAMERLHVLAIWFALFALAFRTLAEGFKPNVEIERYRHYRSALLAVQRRLQDEEGKARAVAMADMERLSFDEMVNFLVANNEARFVM